MLLQSYHLLSLDFEQSHPTLETVEMVFGECCNHTIPSARVAADEHVRL